MMMSYIRVSVLQKPSSYPDNRRGAEIIVPGNSNFGLPITIEVYV
jgi:hypothetical protein